MSYHAHLSSDAPLPAGEEDFFEEDSTDLVSFASRSHHAQFEEILKSILPYLGSDEVKIVLAQVMVALKLEGILGIGMSYSDLKMVNVIKDSILMEPDKRQHALQLAQKLLE